MSKPPVRKRTPTFERFMGEDGQWYWRLLGANGEIVCQSEGYTMKASATKAVKRLGAIAALAVLSACAAWVPSGQPSLTKQAALERCETEASGPLARLFYRDVLIGCMGRYGWDQS